MNRFFKLGVLVAGLIGVIGFFLPMVTLTTEQGFKGDVSAFAAVKGIDKISDHFPAVKNLEATAAAEAAASVEVANENLKKIRPFILAIFIPSLAMLLFGALGVGMGRFGRALGSITLLCALAALLIYGVLGGAFDEARAVKASLGTGIHLVAVSGALGLILGIATLIKPDKGMKRKGKRFKATMASKPPQF